MQMNRACFFVTTLCVALFVAQPAVATDFGEVIPGAGPIHVQVRSIRGERFVHIVRQHTDFSCGAASLATILRYAYHMNVSEQQVLAGMLRVSNAVVVREKGFSLMDIKRYVDTLGMKGVGFRVTAAALYRIKVPVIVLLDLRGYEHFVVLRRVSGDSVYLADPALGNRTMRLDEFVRDWNGIIFAVIGRNFDRNTVLLRPRPSLGVPARVAHDTGMSSAQFMEFGFQLSGLYSLQ